MAPSATFCNLAVSTTFNAELEKSALFLDWVLASGIKTTISIASGILSLPCEDTGCAMHMQLAVVVSLPFDPVHSLIGTVRSSPSQLTPLVPTMYMMIAPWRSRSQSLARPCTYVCVPGFIAWSLRFHVHRCALPCVKAFYHIVQYPSGYLYHTSLHTFTRHSTRVVASGVPSTSSTPTKPKPRKRPNTGAAAESVNPAASPSTPKVGPPRGLKRNDALPSIPGASSSSTLAAPPATPIRVKLPAKRVVTPPTGTITVPRAPAKAKHASTKTFGPFSFVSPQGDSLCNDELEEFYGAQIDSPKPGCAVPVTEFAGNWCSSEMGMIVDGALETDTAAAVHNAVRFRLDCLEEFLVLYPIISPYSAKPPSFDDPSFDDANDPKPERVAHLYNPPVPKFNPARSGADASADAQNFQIEASEYIAWWSGGGADKGNVSEPEAIPLSFVGEEELPPRAAKGGSGKKGGKSKRSKPKAKADIVTLLPVNPESKVLPLLLVPYNRKFHKHEFFGEGAPFATSPGSIRYTLSTRPGLEHCIAGLKDAGLSPSMVGPVVYVTRGKGCSECWTPDWWCLRPRQGYELHAKYRHSLEINLKLFVEILVTHGWVYTQVLNQNTFELMLHVALQVRRYDPPSSAKGKPATIPLVLDGTPKEIHEVFKTEALEVLPVFLLDIDAMRPAGSSKETLRAVFASMLDAVDAFGDFLRSQINNMDRTFMAENLSGVGGSKSGGSGIGSAGMDGDGDVTMVGDGGVMMVGDGDVTMVGGEMGSLEATFRQLAQQDSFRQLDFGSLGRMPCPPVQLSHRFGVSAPSTGAWQELKFGAPALLGGSAPLGSRAPQAPPSSL
ncbi:hypothetical protein DFH09DRAFT_1339769 [Mycena vulgaris]|nr:hypothetical protein DFH09DRAFT_1339769 [Mycena vulgaris]